MKQVEWVGRIHIEKQKGQRGVGVGGLNGVLCVWSCSRVTHLLSPVGALVNLVSDARRGVFQFVRRSFQAKTRA